MSGRAEPETTRLLQLVTRAHQRAATQNANASSALVRVYADLGKPFPEAVAAACLSLGGVHAPVTQTREVLTAWTDERVQQHLALGGRVPGFGNSFYGETPDPAWKAVDEALRAEGRMDRADAIEGQIHEARGRRFPVNAAGYTALCCEVLGIPWGVEALLVLSGRLQVWARIYVEAKG